MSIKIIKSIRFLWCLVLLFALCSCSGVQTSGSNTTEQSSSSVFETSLSDETKNTLSKNGTSESTVPLEERNPKTIPSYLENVEFKGIDISEYSGEIDFEKVKEDGINFVMVRLGGRGYGEEGSLYYDEKALEYIQDAKEAGLKAGGYFFSQAVNEQEAAEEADYAIEVLSGETLDYPIAIDWEEIEDDKARTDNLSDAVLTECAKAFCDRINEKGYKAIIYAKENVFKRYNHTKLSEYDFWYAEYKDTPSVTEGYTMWQYSETGTVKGIEGTTDLNICYKNYEKD